MHGDPAQAEVLVVVEVKLSEGQRRAIQQAANAPVMVLTGGPGCGKTFATATFVKLWRAMGRGQNKVALCAPTGAYFCIVSVLLQGVVLHITYTMSAACPWISNLTGQWHSYGKTARQFTKASALL